MDLGFRGSLFKSRMLGSGFRVQGLGIRIQGSGFERVLGLFFKLGFRVWGFSMFVCLEWIDLCAEEQTH